MYYLGHYLISLPGGNSMTDSISLMQHFQDKSNENANLRLLQAQWNFDRELLPKALQNISVLFPHFSRHDYSHSQHILINIERLLGDTIKLLTVTDTWLLLEAAYWHDIGMIVSSEDIEEDMKSPEFKLYLQDISSQADHELREFVSKFSSLDPANCFAAAETPQQAVEMYRQLLAGWYRGRHPERAAKIVEDPWNSVGISSPRNELVPYRLFRVLGQVCEFHGSDCKSIMDSLPFCQAGMDTDNCHPRFVACMLRLGDLLDLEDNRFCPVMLRIAGSIPSSSKAHIEKHASIRHFRLDPDRVEISAECETYDSYETTDQWFRLIEDEFRYQMAHWSDIVPKREFGLLPTLGRLDVNLATQEILDPGQRPHFDVDPQKAIELLQGAGIYSDGLQCLRELLQNAVDATLMRVWLTHVKNPYLSEMIDWQDPLTKKINNIFRRYPIEVFLSREEGTESGRVQWRLIIRDQGIGISKQDLTYIKSVGSASKNNDRKKIIEEMPKWMRPSGAFGIGLQSVFMLTQEIYFDTKSIFTGDILNITMKLSVESQRGGPIYVHKSEPCPGRGCGTLLTILVEVDRLPKTVSYNQFSAFSSKSIEDYDSIRMEEIPYEAYRMVDAILNFSLYSPIPIKIYINEQPLHVDKSKKRDRWLPEFNKSTGVKLIYLKFEDSILYSTIYYRGQLVKDFHVKFPFVTLEADLLNDTAIDLLTINRNDVNSNSYGYVNKLLMITIIDYLKSEGGRKLSDDEKLFASGFLSLSENESVRSDLINLWMKILLKENINKTIDDLSKLDSFDIYVYSKQPFNLSKAVPPINDSSFCMQYSYYNSPPFKLFLKHWINNNWHIQIDLSDDWDGPVLRFRKSFIDPL
jgi:hypothetical protein